MSDLNITGPAFPLQFDGAGRLKLSRDDAHIYDCMKHVLLTQRGSVPLKPLFGSNLRRRALDTVNHEGIIRHDVTETLEIWESARIEVLGVSSNRSATGTGEFSYNVTYRVRGLDEIRQLISQQGARQ